METIHVGGVPEHFNLPWHLCIEGGDFKKENVNVTWTDFPGGTGEMSEALKTGQVDLAVMLTEGCVKEICDGSAFKIIQTYIESPLLWGIHVHANSNFHHIDDLKHKTAAISRLGSGSHLMTYVHAQNQNWDTAALKFNTTQHLAGAKTSLTKGTSDYFLWEHFTTKPLVDEGVFRRLGDEPTPWPCFVIVSTSSFIETHKNTIVKLLEVLNQKSKNFKHSPGIEHEISERYNLELEDVKKWLAITEWSQQQLSKNDIILTQNRLKDLNLISTKKDFQEFIF